MPPRMGAELVALLPRLRRYAVALCRSSALADDLVQGACERALTNADTWQIGSRFDAWVFRILRNLWIDTSRKAGRRIAGMEFEDASEVPDMKGEQQINDRLLLKDVLNAVAALPAEQREVLLLVCVEDLAYREAAEVLGVPTGTVMSRLARARKRLAGLADGRSYPSDVLGTAGRGGE
jgi:RNA polymerase sigma-70 factor (ECF subfamily)